ncbi:MAG: PadR family transcriptional regulator [Gemmatimonadaceae bacterium]|nr:PadR family transcriptional regulator [Gemmatimonadaceae bacterium]
MSLRYAVLGFLSISPYSGYDLKRFFNASVRHFWSADQAAIYRTLAELEGEELVVYERVEQQTRPDRKVYHITPAGVRALDAWLTQPAPSQVRREPLLLKLFFASRVQGDDLAALLGAELAATDAELASFRAILASIEQDTAAVERDAGTAEAIAAHARLLVGPLITLSNGVRLGVAYRDWLRSLLAAQAGGTLTASALLADLHGQLDGA